MSYIIQGKDSFDSAHYLSGHEGKCSNLHGHRWTVEYALIAEQLIPNGPSEGMVIDFTEVKDLVKQLLENYDHKLIMTLPPKKETANEFPTCEEQFVMACCNMGFDIIFVDFRPTAENMAKHFFDKIQLAFDLLPDIWHLDVDFVRVFETPNNSATYMGGR